MEDELLIDVKEQMAEERRNRLLKKYGSFLGYCAIGIVVLFGGYEAWKTHDTGVRQEMGDAFITSISEDAAEVDLAKFEGQAGYTQIATLAKATKLAEAGEKDKAIEQYQSIWENEENEAAIKRTAKIRAALLMVNSNSTETPSWLNSDDDAIFNSQFNELAAIHSLQNSNGEKAEKILNDLKESPTTTATVKNRTDAYLSEIENN